MLIRNRIQIFFQHFKILAFEVTLRYKLIRIEPVVSKFFLKFLLYLMIFQSMMKRRCCRTLKNYEILGTYDIGLFLGEIKVFEQEMKKRLAQFAFKSIAWIDFGYNPTHHYPLTANAGGYFGLDLRTCSISLGAISTAMLIFFHQLKI